VTLFNTQLSSLSFQFFLSYDKVFYAALEVLSYHFRGGIEEDHEKKPYDSLRPGRDVLWIIA